MAEWQSILEEIARAVFGLICHQDPSILMKVGGREIPLCPRCMGLHLGFLCSFIALKVWTAGRITRAGKTTKFVLVAGLGSMAVDWWIGGHLGLFAPTTLTRLITGLAGGSALGILFSSYRRSLILLPNSSAIKSTAPKAASLICFSTCVGIAVTSLSGWVLLLCILLLTFAANVSLTVHTVILIVRSRLFPRPVLHGSPFHEGG